MEMLKVTGVCCVETTGAVLLSCELQINYKVTLACFATSRWGPQPQCGLYKPKRYQTATVNVHMTLPIDAKAREWLQQPRNM